METKDGRQAFDFSGRYDKVVLNSFIEYTISDNRKVVNTFTASGEDTIVTETFDPETETPVDVQRNFTQSVLNNFKKYAEKE